MTKVILLSKGKSTIVDDDDFERLSRFLWCCTANDYAQRTIPRSAGGGKALMHRDILGAQKGDVVDHKNRDTLDNRRANLRLCRQGQNCLNRIANRGATTSPYKGVYWNKNAKKWAAEFMNKYIGYFVNEEEAAMAYNVVAYGHDPVHALLNEVEMG